MEQVVCGNIPAGERYEHTKGERGKQSHDEPELSGNPAMIVERKR